MDNSNRLDKDSFDKLKLNAKGIIDEYQIGSDQNTRAALLTYNDEPSLLVPLDSGTSGKELKSILDSININTEKEPRLDKALVELNRLLDERMNSQRRDVPVNVLVLAKGTLWSSYLAYSSEA